MASTTSRMTKGAELLFQLIDEGQDERKKFEAQWKRNKELDGGTHWETTAPEGRSHNTYNLIQNSINGMMAVMTERRPGITIEPVETVDEGMYYARRKAIQQIRAMEFQGLIDLGRATDMMQAGEAMPPELIEPLLDTGLIQRDDFILFNDPTLAELLDAIVQGTWDWYNWDWKIPEAWRAALVLGHRDVIFEWDEQLEDTRLKFVLEKDSWCDANPANTDVEDWQNYIYAEVMPVDQAVMRFPKHEEAIRAFAEDPDNINLPDGTKLSRRYSDITWERDMAVILTGWLRNQVIPTPDGPMTGLREIRTVSGQTLYDGPSRYRDMPVARFKNITITDSSYAQGMPELLQDPQATINRLLSNLTDQARFLPAPQQVMAQSVFDAMGDETLYSHPNRVWVVPDNLLEESRRNPVDFVVPPGLDPSHITLLLNAFQIFHDLSSQGDVQRGIASSNAQSGKAIESLQAAARGVIGLRSSWMEKAVGRAVRLTYTNAIDFMSPEKAAMYTDKFPPNVIADMLRRAQAARFNVTVEVSSGRGQRKQFEQEKALALRQQGDLSLETFHEKSEIDHKRELGRMIEEANLKAGLQQQAAAQAIEQGGVQPPAA